MNKRQIISSTCIPITKIAETNETADYQFSADISEPHPLHRDGAQVVGQASGIFRINKKNGEITLIKEMPGDKTGKRYSRAAEIIKKYWEAKEFPDSTSFASG